MNGVPALFSGVLLTSTLMAVEPIAGPPMTTLERPVPAWLTTAVVYQIYPQSYADSNGDGIGDLPGIIGKLDYLKSLGVSAIWLNPIYDSPFHDAGYDVRDYRLVAPRYGTNEDAKRLFAEAHRRGIRVVLDLVAGHCSAEHAWFKEAAASATSAHANWFLWSNTQPSKSWVASPGARPGFYLKNFFDSQPALNYGYSTPNSKNPWERSVDDPACREVREAMREVMRFWLDLGCDGFRVDMAASLVKGGGKGLAALWQDYRTWMKAAYPEAVLVSEWSQPTSAITAGFDVDFMIHFGSSAYRHLVQPTLEPNRSKPAANTSFFSREGAGDITAFLKDYLPHYEASKKLGFIALPTGNHDFSRPRSLGRDLDDLRVLYAGLLTLPGVPFVYYGDEIGMRDLPGWPRIEGAMWRGSCRSPMQWAVGPGAGFSTADPGKFYLPLDPDPQRPTVAAQDQDPDSLLNLVRTLIRLRTQEPSLGNRGALTVLYAEPKSYPFVYLRSGGPSDIIVALNPTAEARTWRDARLAGATPLLVRNARVAGTLATLGPVSFSLWRCSRP